MWLMGNKFRYFLTLDNERTELVFAPRGWDTETIGKFQRDMNYFGIIRSLSLPLQFVEDGAQLLKYAFNKYGIEAGVRLEVEKLKNLWDYETIFRSDLDFSKYNPVGNDVNIMLLETGIGKDIKAKEGIKYEFALNGADVVNIVLPGVQFSEESIWITKYIDTTDLNVAKRFVIGMDLVTNGFGSGFLGALNTSQRNAADSDDFGGDKFVLGQRAGGVSSRIRGNVKGFIAPNGEAPSRICELVVKSTISGNIYQIYVGDSDSENPVYFDVDFDFPYTLQQGEGLVLYSRSDTSPSVPYLYVSEGEIRISYASISNPSNCKGIRSFDLFKRIMARVSPSTTVDSVFLKTVRKNLIFTSGSAIREISDAKIKISLKDFFQTIYSLNDVGLGTDGNFKLETASSFIRPIQIMDVGNVKDFAQENAEELLGNSVTIGYDDGNTDAENGREEYNCGQVWGLPITSIQKELQWKSPTRADQYGIEQMRVTFNVSKTATSDNKSDNDNFMIDCNPINGEGNFTPILGSQLTLVTGLSYPLTAYNLLLSPKHNLLNHAPYLRSILDRLDGRFIEFGSGEKNTDILVVASGQVVDEDKSIRVGDLQGKYFQPYIYNITCKLPRNAIQLIDSNPFGYITFNWNGTTASGYPLEVPVDLAGNKEQTLKLLATDFSLLP